MAAFKATGSARSPSTGSYSVPARPRRSVFGRSKTFTESPRAFSSWTRLAPTNPEAPVTKHFMNGDHPLLGGQFQNFFALLNLFPLEF